MVASSLLTRLHMKSHSLRYGLLSCLFLLLAPSSLPAAADTETLFQEGVAAYEAQNWALAAQIFSQVYRVTRNPRAQFYLKNAKLKLHLNQPAVTLEKKLSEIILPEVNFEETDLPTVFQFLRAKVEEISKGTLQPNILYKRDPSNPATPAITLQLSHVPVTEVLRYVAEMTGNRIKYEPYAVLCSPVGSE